jgi:hypothetical protein
MTGQPDPVRHLGDDPDAGEASPLAGHQQHTRIAAHFLEGQGDRHAGKYDRVV